MGEIQTGTAMAGTAEPAASAGFFRAKPMLALLKLKSGAGAAVLVRIVRNLIDEKGFRALPTATEDIEPFEEFGRGLGIHLCIRIWKGRPHTAQHTA